MPLRAMRPDGRSAIATLTGNQPRRRFTIADLVGSDNIMFAATGITAGDILSGVRFRHGGARTHSVVMRKRSGTIRYITAQHFLRPQTALLKRSRVWRSIVQDLFGNEPTRRPRSRRRGAVPLAERMRPRSWDEFRGQEHLLGPGGALRAVLDKGRSPARCCSGAARQRQDDAGAS
jgi:hypothetical protein